MRIVDGAGADDDQQTGVFTVEDRANRLAVSGDLPGQGIAEGQLLFELQRTWKAQGQRFVGRGEGRQWQSRDGRVHVQASWAAAGCSRALGPTGVFDNWPDWLRVCACHLWVTDRRRQAVPSGGW
ncbi:hypothetical protein D3C76_695080 [compost metagenome]